MISLYTDELHERCKTWAEMITDPRRSLAHRAALIKFVKTCPDLKDQIEMLVTIKTNIQLIQEHKI